MFFRNAISEEEEKRFFTLERNKATILCVAENELHHGILGTSSTVELFHPARNRAFKITVSQNGARCIKVEAAQPVRASVLWDVFQDLERFLMLFDGHFLKIHSATFYEGEHQTEWSDELFDAFIKRRPSLYYSADFVSGQYGFSLCPLPVISTEMFERFIDIELDLGLIHRMALYNMADTGITPDCKCAQLIEVYEPLFDLMKKKKLSVKLQKPFIKKSYSVLKRNLIRTIETFGQDIFPEELKHGIDTITQIFVNSRNRIAHIKGKQKRIYLDGQESVLYAAKLSMLYRRLLLEMLKVDYNSYKKSLVNASNIWYRWWDIYDHFIEKRVSQEKEWEQEREKNRKAAKWNAIRNKLRKLFSRKKKSK